MNSSTPAATSRTLIVLILACSMLLLKPVYAEWETEDAILMGTTIRVEIWHQDSEIRQRGIVRVLEEMERINRMMSPYIAESQLSIINEHAHERPVAIDHDLFRLIRKSNEISVLTEGAFDITYASVGHLFNYRKQTKPSDEKIEQAKKFTDFRNLVLDENQRTVSFAKRGVKIDLGGIAKGFAVDQAIEHLHELGIEHALVSAGGDMRLIGDRLGSPWLVGIRNPQKPEETIITLPFQNGALSTSGGYERYFVQDGVTHHHILHPGTGKSARGIRSASVLGNDTMTTDALSTSVFVLGLTKGLELLNDLEGIEGVIIDKDSKLHYSEGLKQHL